jgi:aspartyl-tRNA(Asn)/glutamyl-tRNA(Gln) amidotransferase subunit B
MISEEVRNKYQAVIGLEIHAQMDTNTKAYSSDENQYGSEPNSNISSVSLGYPGTLPVPNKRVIEYAIRMGLATQSDIREDMFYARKNYFYPDLPKGYQITQDKTPICNNGRVFIKDENGNEKEIGLTRIHMEEDAGKSMHDIDPFNTLVDLNRAGVPLIEIVSEPDLRSSQEAYNYVAEMRKLVRYLDICDGNMEEGSLRCDANISVMLKDAKEFGTKVEVKNMNSMRNVQRAIEFEINRQISVIESGEGKLVQETRGFNAVDGSTSSMRSKEDDNDYRFFPEPDIQPLKVTKEDIQQIQDELPPLPRDLYIKYTNEFGLSDYDANNIIENKEIALFFEEVLNYTKNYKAAVNWIMGDAKSYLNEKAVRISEFPISAMKIAELIDFIDTGKINSSIASQKVFPILLKDNSKGVEEICKENNWIQESNEDSILEFINKVITDNPSEVARFKGGEKKLSGFFMGQLMKVSKGKADPKVAGKLLQAELNKQ